MPSFSIKITLRDPCIFSASGSTEGEHTSLDFIPGAVLRGVAAAKLYRSCEPDDAWQLFHSGHVRFGPAYPVEADKIALPAPLSFHYEKAKGQSAATKIFVEGLHDLSASTITTDEQLEQLRNCWIIDANATTSVSLQGSLRTAIADTTGTADPGRIFGFQSVADGSVFLATIEADKEEDLDRVQGAFQAQEIRLGRSRSSEYGRARAEIVEPECSLPDAPKQPDDYTRIYCLTDICLIDDLGMPARRLTSTLFGLGSGEVDWPRCFIRQRSVRNFNRALGTIERDLVLIEKGSVITLKGVTQATSSEKVVGIGREIGLGKIWINPGFLGFGAGIGWPARSLPQIRQHPPVTENGEPSKLIAWRLHEVKRISAAGDVRREVDTLFNSLREARKVSELNGLGAWPTSTQWGKLSDKSDKPEDINSLLFKPVPGEAKAQANDAWRAMVPEDGKLISLAEWLKTRTKVKSSAVLRELARLARQEAEKQEKAHG